jgi:hypothetical protein
MPKPDADQKDWDAFYGKTGRPESPDGYDFGDFAPPEGMPWDESLQGRLTERMHKLGLSNAQMNGAIRALAEEQNTDWVSASTEGVAQFEKAKADLKSEWGVAYDAKVEMAERAWNYAFGDKAALVKDVQIPGLGTFGSIPEVVRAFEKMGSGMQEDKLVTSATNAGLNTIDRSSALAEYNKLNAEKREIILNSGHPEHKEVTARRSNLAAIAFAD